MSVSEAKPTEQTVYYGSVELETPMGTLSQGSGNANITTETVNDPKAQLLVLHLHNGHTASMNLYLTQEEGWALVESCIEGLNTLK